MSIDPVTEFISHFSGLFGLVSEQSRMRIEYKPFEYLEEEAEDPGELPNVNLDLQVRYDFKNFNPNVEYEPTSHYIPPAYVDTHVSFGAPVTAQPVNISSFDNFGPSPFPSSGGVPGTDLEIPSFDPPGSLAFVVKQSNRLNDDDFVDFSGQYSGYSSDINQDYYLNYLIEQFEIFSPITALSGPASEEQIAELIEAVAAEINAYNAQVEHGENSDAFFDEDVSGSYENGEQVDETSVLSDEMPGNEDELGEDLSDEPTQSSLEGEGPLSMVSEITVEAGQNTLINEVILSSTWSTGSVVAVSGDSHDVNVISQINIFNDHDTIAETVNNVSATSSQATQAFNIATVTETWQDPPAEENAGETDSSAEDLVFPSFWAVTRLEADLVFLNSVEQVNFVSDSDTHILTSTMSETSLITGGNTAVNGFTALEIGFNYDLIIVTGNYHNANIILQTNILLDNDAINQLGDGGTGSDIDVDLVTGDNLLWNQAHIHSIGSTSYGDAPDYFADQAESLAGGSNIISQNVLNDALFEGLFGLNVLFIEGNIYDLQYISQTNILGDSDEINILAEEFTDSSETEWEISTGGNTTINMASIVDVGPDATVLVGGDHYSDALIHQAELAPDIPPEGVGDELVSEAVVFLVDEMLEGDSGNGETVNPTINHQPNADADLMQTMLS